MRTIAVTGATGFIGRHLVRCLVEGGAYRVLAIGRNEKRLKESGTDYVVYDLNEERSDWYELLGRPDVLVHLAWEGFPDYNGLFHIERNLMGSYRFIKTMVQAGLPGLTVAGTCYEYGLQSGCLAEDTPTAPTTCYGIAKDSLRRFLEVLHRSYDFSFRWARLFFLYGEGQNEKALIPQLDQAIESGAPAFDMSGGEQLRDYLPVEHASELLAHLSLQKDISGVFNICSGKPISVRHLVEQQIERKQSGIALNLGVLPYPKHEPMAYWGDPSLLHKTLHGGVKA